MHPELEHPDIMIDHMQVRPDWVHIENLSLPTHIDTLIVVAGHALFRATTRLGDPSFDPRIVDFWSLNEFQDAEELGLLIEHIHSGVQEAATRPNSILVFSGACTRDVAGAWTEAESYFAVAEYFKWWEEETGIPADVMRARSFVDTNALDSMENLTRSIAVYKEVHPRGEMPLRVMVVGWKFKQERFSMHSRELRIPNFSYVGVNNPAHFSAENEKKVVALYKEDPLGESEGGVLQQKKMKRDVRGILRPGFNAEIRTHYLQLMRDRKLPTARDN